MGWESAVPKHRADLRSERDGFQHIPEKAETQQQAKEELSVSSSRDSSPCQPEVGGTRVQSWFFPECAGLGTAALMAWPGLSSLTDNRLPELGSFLI